MIALAAVAALVGGVFGFLADRLAARWPEHEPGVAPRGLDWRTALVVLAGAGIFGALVLRWPDPRDLAVLGIYCAALIVLLATDLDQKLLPLELTLPLIAFSGLVLVAGWSPLLTPDLAGVLSGVAAGLGAPLFLAVTDRVLTGALGAGDLKLAMALGLMSGASRLFSGFLVSSVLASLLLLLLIAARRLGMRTAIPFGPILIGAGFVAALLP